MDERPLAEDGNPSGYQGFQLTQNAPVPAVTQNGQNCTTRAVVFIFSCKILDLFYAFPGGKKPIRVNISNPINHGIFHYNKIC